MQGKPPLFRASKFDGVLKMIMRAGEGALMNIRAGEHGIHRPTTLKERIP